MSTRGCVAIKKGNGWEGVYNHYDSYPAGLGVEVYRHLKKLLKDETSFKEFPNRLLHAGDWENYLAGCKCQYCGKQEVGQAHSIAYIDHSADEIKANIEKTGFPDPDCKYHQHGDLNDTMTDKTADALFIEWVYVVDMEEKKFHVLVAHEIEPKKREIVSNSKFSRENYSWSEVVKIDLLAQFPVPDFEEIDRKGCELYKKMSEKLNKRIVGARK